MILTLILLLLKNVLTIATQALLAKTYIRANHTRFIIKELCKAGNIKVKIKKTVLKDRTKKKVANTKKKQRNVCVYLFKKAKKDFLEISA